MSVDYDDNLAPVIYIGDGDVLSGATATPGAVILWMRLRKPNDGLDLNVVTLVSSGENQSNGTELFTVYFVSKASLDAMIEMLSRTRDKAFPQTQE